MTKTRGSFEYSDLFAYIKKNQALPAKVKEIEEINEQQPDALKSLIEGIKNGDLSQLDMPIQIDKKTEIDRGAFLLFLFKHNKINCNEFMTLYQYYLALIEFTDKCGTGPEPKNKDKKIWNEKNKDAFALNIHPLVEKGILTQDGISYISRVVHRFKENFDIDLDEDELKKFILSLSPIEQLAVEFEMKETDAGYEDLINGVSSIIEPRHHTHGHIFLFPSYSLSLHLLSKINAEFMIPRPAFGTISSDTLLKLHEKEMHIYSLFHPDIKSNLPSAHDETGAFFIAGHDLFHVYSASNLTKENRTILYQDLPPFLLDFKRGYMEWIAKNLKDKQDKFVEVMDELIYDSLNDLVVDLEDMSAKDLKEQPDKLFHNFLKDSFSKALHDNKFFHPTVTDENNLSQICTNHPYLILFYFIAQKKYQSDSNSEIWNLLYDKMKRLVDKVFNNIERDSGFSVEKFRNIPKALDEIAKGKSATIEVGEWVSAIHVGENKSDQLEPQRLFAPPPSIHKEESEEPSVNRNPSPPSKSK